MSREIKLGAFAFIVLLVAIWGYTYLKGENLLNKSFTFKTTFTNVTQLNRSSPVYINGYKVGSVLSIFLNPEKLNEVIVEFYVENDYKIPTNATVNMISDGLIAGRALSVAFDKQCSGPDCAKKGHMFPGKTIGMIQSMLGGDATEVERYVGMFGEELKKTIYELGTKEGKGAINNSLMELEKTMANMSELTATTSSILSKSANNLTSTMDNMNTITGNLAASNTQITEMLSNFNAISTQLKDANVGNTITSTTETLESAQKAIEQLQGTLANTEKTMQNLDGLLTKAGSGDGTLSKLLNDKELYTNLELTSKNLSLLLQDLRLNPSRYVKVSVFGGKNKDPYVKPEEDPAFKN
jgi:phospholipid/cholesterol/gamma-HCH transport system substrate-binding protein